MKPLIAAFLLLASAAVPSLNARTWTNTEGQTMDSDLISVEAEFVLFSRDGRTYKYPLSNLSDEDQEYIKKWAVEDAKPPVILNEFRNQLVRLEGRSFRTIPEGTLEDKRLFAFYYSAGWCGPCRAFTPDLVKAYQRIQAEHPEFEIIFISSDRDSKAMTEYMKSEKMPFAALKFERKNKSSLARKHAQRGIPNLVFMDRSGEAISTSYVNGKYIGPGKVLKDIEEYLAQQ